MHLLIIALVATIGATPVIAAPQVRGFFSGSYFFARATNSENRAYNCNFSYSFQYSDFGVTKTRQINGTFGVVANANDLEVIRTTGSWVNPQLTNFSYQCT